MIIRVNNVNKRTWNKFKKSARKLNLSVGAALNIALTDIMIDHQQQFNTKKY